MSSKFGQMRPLVSMATIELKWGKCCVHSSAFIFDRIFFILAGNEDIHNISDEFKIQQIGPRTAELAALERLEKSS